MDNNDKKNDNLEMAEYTLDIDIASNYYSAFLIVEIFDDDCRIFSKDIEAFLEEKNIVHGIDYSVIEKIVETPTQGKFLVAKGKEHINGENAKIDYKFDVNSELHPEKNEDGSVDYKKMHLLQKINEGEILATKKPLTEGKNGMTVTGKEIYAKNGKDINFKVGKGVVFSDDGLSIKAEYTGAISFENGKVSVEKVLELNDGVGINTGNIDFNGKIVVNGIVESGYTIKSTDDIIVNGIVESATLISDKNIEITKGVQGNDNALIKCKENFKARFVNSSELIVGGDISLDIIMHSKVSCNGKLTALGQKGTVVGGEYTIKKGVDAKIVGSEMGTITNFRIGIDNELLNNYKKALEDSKKYGDEVRELTKNEKIMKKKIDSGNRNQLVVSKYKKTLERLKEIKPLLDKAKKDVKVMRKQFSNLKGSNLVAGFIYPGVKINITNSFYNVKEELTRVEITKKDGEVRIIGR